MHLIGDVGNFDHAGASTSTKQMARKRGMFRGSTTFNDLQNEIRFPVAVKGNLSA